MDDLPPRTPPHPDSAHFPGGPADGAIRPVALDADGRPPALLTWCADGVFVGTSDLPAPAALVTYERCDKHLDDPITRWVYRHVGTLGG